jgi:outer membrane protein assembly factor BamB
MKNISFAILIVFASTICTMGQDWSQWRGVERQGIWHEDGIIDQFPDDGLKVKWRVPIGSGYAGPAVANGRVFVLDWTEDASSRTLDGTERLLVLDEETGGELWTAEWQTS